MFHQGDLQSGIGRAISEQKLVACFIRSDNEESQKWEQQWFGIGRRPAPIDIWALKAVFLRLEFGSQEAGFLNAFCPITSSPTLVVIDKGKVLEKIEAGIARDDFMVRLSKALDLEMHVVNKGEFEKAKQATQAQATASSSAAAAAASSTEAATSSTEAAPPTYPESARTTTAEASDARPSVPATHDQPVQSPALSSTDSRSNAAPSNPTTDMSSLFPNRAQRHEEEAAKRATAEKAERAARAKARRIEEEQALARDKGKGKATQETEKEKSRRDWIAQQKVRKDEAKKDKERILAQIEADKQERKARTQRAAAEAASESSPLPTSIDAASKRRMGAGGMCSLQVRLFDGTSIKGRFEPSATLDSTVREWIKTTTVDQGNVNAADVPFTFKQIISPLPSRSIEVSEERQTLADLGLTPNATLVLVPIAGYTEAYSGNAGRGYMSSALHYTYALANGASSMLGSALSYVPGLSGPAAAGSPTESHSRQSGAHSSDDSPTTLDGSSESAGSSRIKVKTLADQRAEADRQREKNPEFYNGNSSAFEGRKDDDHHKD
ncbi:Putative UBX domain, Ubiquitin-like domain superfamily [Septoria linicola]|uniref:UBX domain, Ubiquitin-like domain superfamily n=1 Tax=Septoria linicola TaxID=215465 RepID=A0A9Q9EI24_9PEZI|nr:Putative UBX domain, Ubiquitin-like domain superfamily [Septoria linicola]